MLGESQKPIIIYTNQKDATVLRRKRTKGKESLVIRNADGSVTGRSKELRASQAYPEEFGKSVANLSLRKMHSTVFNDTFG